MYTFQYAQPVTKRGAKKESAETAEEKKLSHHAQRSLDEKKKGESHRLYTDAQRFADMIIWPDAKIDPLLETQFAAGRLYAAISSRPGQSGRADGYILEGKELEVSYKCIS